MAKTGAEAPGTSGSQFFSSRGPTSACRRTTRSSARYGRHRTVDGSGSSATPPRSADTAGRDRFGHGRGAVSSRQSSSPPARRRGSAPEAAAAAPEVLERLSGPGGRDRRRRRRAHARDPGARRHVCGWKRGPERPSRSGLAELGDDVEAAVVVLADGPDLAAEAVERVIDTGGATETPSWRPPTAASAAIPARGPRSLGAPSRRRPARAPREARAVRRPRLTGRRGYPGRPAGAAAGALERRRTEAASASPSARGACARPSSSARTAAARPRSDSAGGSSRSRRGATPREYLGVGELAIQIALQQRLARLAGPSHDTASSASSASAAAGRGAAST